MPVPLQRNARIASLSLIAAIALAVASISPQTAEASRTAKGTSLALKGAAIATAAPAAVSAVLPEPFISKATAAGLGLTALSLGAISLGFDTYDFLVDAPPVYVPNAAPRARLVSLATTTASPRISGFVSMTFDPKTGGLVERAPITRGRAGQVVGVVGRGFGTSLKAITLRIGDVKIPVMERQERDAGKNHQLLLFTVPPIAEPGDRQRVSVTVKVNGATSNKASFVAQTRRLARPPGSVTAALFERLSRSYQAFTKFRADIEMAVASRLDGVIMTNEQRSGAFEAYADVKSASRKGLREVRLLLFQLQREPRRNLVILDGMFDASPLRDQLDYADAATRDRNSDGLPDTINGVKLGMLCARLPAHTSVPAATPGSDFLRGTAADDNLDGQAGTDILCGELGADSLLGGTGPDLLIGGPGVDVLDGGPGDDVCVGLREIDVFRGCETRIAG